MSENLGRENWKAFCARVGAVGGPVSWRWAAVPQSEDDWGLVALVIEAGSTVLPDPRIDRYPKAIVAVEELSAEEAAARLDAFVVGMEGEEPKVGLPEQHDVVLQRVWAGEEWALTTVGWPRLIATAGGGAAIYADPGIRLSAPDQTFYPSLGDAVAERVYRLPPARVRINQVAPLCFLLVDRRGRIAGLTARAERIAIDMEEGIPGGLEGFDLRLAWRPEPDAAEWSRDNRPCHSPGVLELPMDGVPAEFVVALLDPDGEEVDRRILDPQTDVAAEDPETLEGLVARWIGEGEHVHLEYKRELNAKANVSFAETVAAFANGAGGAILIGIGDDGTVIGWDAEKPIDRVTDIIASLVQEKPLFDVHEVPAEGRPITVVRVASSPIEHRPHVVRDRVMVRLNATTRAANPAEVRSLTAGTLGPRF
jgi:Putative DNA-binding domain